MQVMVEADSGWDRLLDQLHQAAQAQRRKHGLLLIGIGAKVAAQEGIRVLQLAQGRQLGHDGSLL
ncbi:hypothetical protein D9M71_557020 [compost metagenome]